MLGEQKEVMRDLLFTSTSMGAMTKRKTHLVLIKVAIYIYSLTRLCALRQKTEITSTRTWTFLSLTPTLPSYPDLYIPLWSLT